MSITTFSGLAVDHALKSIEKPDHDVCLLDYRLGERNGLDLLYETMERIIAARLFFSPARAT